MRTFRLLTGLCLVVGLSQAQASFADDGSSYDKVSFYFAAHQDDWQLFMNPSAFDDVASAKTKTVFVHMTAGDAGLGMRTGGRKHPFYRARENGAELAIRFMADGDKEPTSETASDIPFNGHRIHRVAYRNTVGYFLRLPDGNLAGTGYPETGYQSLLRLARGEIDRLSAVDNSAAYQGWSDLVSTLQMILDFERGEAPTVQLNVPEPDPRINPDDHLDHLMTAKAALDGAKWLACARRAYYVGYASARLPENLTSHKRDLESSVFAVTAAGVRALGHKASWDWYDQSYVGRNYFRVEEGSGPCDVAPPEPAVVAKR